MSEVKLFGKTIQLHSNDGVLDRARGADLVADSDHNFSDGSALSLDEKSDGAMDSSGEDPETPSKDKEESESSISQESKRPDKILPCPRCKSNETKFCYFNNYNLNQPRHFCKGCQRYWTAGGAVRNVPIGSGRRKNKSPLVQSPQVADNSGSSHCVAVTNETEQLPKKNSEVHGFSPGFPAPPWYPAQWGLMYTTTPFLSYGVHSSGSLGKHSRGGGDKEEGGNGTKTSRVLAPKTLRIGDPGEAAKSSVWATLGIKNEKGNSIGSSSVFGGFQLKTEGANSVVADGSLVLQANPAAFSRSLRFHESAE